MVEVAARAHVSVETLRKIETGRSPSPEFFTIANICSALGITMEQLLLKGSGSVSGASAAS
jgi:transcriptional regulator with XRE-family HTH domain